MEITAPVIFCYHASTGELLETALADPDPLDPTNWLIPANATIDAPPVVPKGSVARRVESRRWEVVPDNRGLIYSTTNGQPLQLSQLGAVPEGFTRVAPPGPHHTWKKGAWEIDQDAQLVALVGAATDRRNSLQAEASARIAPLQDLVELGEATGAEESALLAWKRYRGALNRVEQQPAYPRVIEWPSQPQVGA